jgi:hypothetical protein
VNIHLINFPSDEIKLGASNRVTNHLGIGKKNNFSCTMNPPLKAILERLFQGKHIWKQIPVG